MIEQASDAFLCVVDLQEKLVPTQSHPAELMKRVGVMLGGARALEIPFVAAQQYPKGLGELLPEVKELLPEGTPVTDKITFSCFGTPEFAAAAAALGRKQMILLGVETHVCVLQTALDAMKLGYEVYLAEDCTDSRHEFDRAAGLALMRESGVKIVTGEMLLFQLMHDSKHPAFKTVSRLVR